MTKCKFGSTKQIDQSLSRPYGLIGRLAKIDDGRRGLGVFRKYELTEVTIECQEPTLVQGSLFENDAIGRGRHRLRDRLNIPSGFAQQNNRRMRNVFVGQ